MNGFSQILNSIVTLGIAMAVGFIAVKTKYISEEVKNAISKLIVRITLPILVVTSLTKVPLTVDKIRNSVLVVVLGLLVVGLLYLVGTALSKAFHMDRPRAVVYRALSAFGNVIFMAYPLIEALYGPEGILYAALYAFANDCFVWTLAVYQLASISGEGKSRRENLKNLINPATIAFVISFVMMIFGWKFTGVFGAVLNGIGGTTTYLSMLFIGGTLALVDFRHIYKRGSLFLAILIKMVLMPLLLAVVLHFLPVDRMVAEIILLQVAMPAQTILTILTTEYKGDTILAAEGVFLSTVAGLVTLPLVYFMIQMIL